MTTQLARRAGTQLRDDHIETNPVTTSAERFVLLTSPHGWQANNIDQLFTGLGGTTILWTAGGGQFSAIVSSGATAPDGSATAVRVGPSAAASPNAYMRVLLSTLPGAFRNWPNTVTGDAFSFLVCAKADVLTQCAIRADAISTAPTVFDLTTGAVVGTDPASGKIKSVSLGGGWWGFFCVGVTQPASPSHAVYIYGAKAGATSWNCTLEDTIFVWWGCAFDKCAQPTLPFTGGASGLDNAGDGKFPFYNPITEGGEIVSVPLPASVQTPAALTVYMEWLDRANQLAATAPGVFRLGNQANTGDGINVTQTSTGFSGTYTNGASTSTATVTLATSFGDLVTLRATLDASGALTLNASKNGATEVNGSAGSAAGLATSWSDNLIMPNCLGVGTSNTQGDMALRKLRLFKGVQSLPACQA